MPWATRQSLAKSTRDNRDGSLWSAGRRASGKIVDHSLHIIAALGLRDQTGVDRARYICLQWLDVCQHQFGYEIMTNDGAERPASNSSPSPKPRRSPTAWCGKPISRPALRTASRSSWRWSLAFSPTTRRLVERVPYGTLRWQ